MNQLVWLAEHVLVPGAAGGCGGAERRLLQRPGDAARWRGPVTRRLRANPSCPLPGRRGGHRGRVGVGDLRAPVAGRDTPFTWARGSWSPGA